MAYYAKKDLYAEVTQKIIASLEKGVAPWVKPWKSIAGEQHGMPFNYISKKAYRGINVFLLGLQPYASNAWMTFNQARNIGAHVRKGEHGSMIVFFKPFKIKEKQPNGEMKEKSIPLLRSFIVFNIEQIDGLPETKKPEGEPTVPVQPTSNYPHADALLAQANIRHGLGVACYSPIGDFITMPAKADFVTEADYYATGLHELTHWTGHKDRCAREFGARFGNDAYAREELVAEMGAAFLCAGLQIEGKLQHAEYIGHWLKILKSDKKAVIFAASQAQKAADFIHAGVGSAEEAHDEDEGEESSPAALAA